MGHEEIKIRHVAHTQSQDRQAKENRANDRRR
jgi:hypothetical protein